MDRLPINLTLLAFIASQCSPKPVAAAPALANQTVLATTVRFAAPVAACAVEQSVLAAVMLEAEEVHATLASDRAALAALAVASVAQRVGASAASAPAEDGACGPSVVMSEKKATRCAHDRSFASSGRP